VIELSGTQGWTVERNSTARSPHEFAGVGNNYRQALQEHTDSAFFTKRCELLASQTKILLIVTSTADRNSRLLVDLNVVEEFVQSFYSQGISNPPERVKPSGRSCPSQLLESAEYVFATYDSEAQKFTFLSESLPIPVTLQSTMTDGVMAERARLGGPCIPSACIHWSRGCSLGRAVAASESAANDRPEHCPIRSTCRWFSENGPRACAPCQFLRNIDFTHS